MRVYISCDMEGIGGIALREQVMSNERLYEASRYLMVREVNAAVKGAFEGGATQVIVRDAHARGFNFPVEELLPEAEYIMGGPLPERFPYLASEADVMFLVGYHALHGTQAAVRDHTMSSFTWSDFWLNGKLLGETGIDAALAGVVGVPVGLVTGDDKVCAEATELLGAVETAQVKRALARHCARFLAPERARQVVRQAAKRATERAAAGEFSPPRFDPPYTIRLRYQSTDVVDGRLYDDAGVTREDGRTLVYRGDDLAKLIWRVLR